LAVRQASATNGCTAVASVADSEWVKLGRFGICVIFPGYTGNAGVGGGCLARIGHGRRRCADPLSFLGTRAKLARFPCSLTENLAWSLLPYPSLQGPLRFLSSRVSPGSFYWLPIRVFSVSGIWIPGLSFGWRGSGLIFLEVKWIWDSVGARSQTVFHYWAGAEGCLDDDTFRHSHRSARGLGFGAAGAIAAL
jgi:hypothetical protein